MFIYNENNELRRPFNAAIDAADISQLKREYNELYLETMKREVLKLVNASRASEVNKCLYHMRAALNDLCLIGSLLVSINDTYPSVGPRTPQYQQLPRLRGRALVKITFQKLPPSLFKPTTERGLGTRYFSCQSLTAVLPLHCRGQSSLRALQVSHGVADRRRVQLPRNLGGLHRFMPEGLLQPHLCGDRLVCVPGEATLPDPTVRWHAVTSVPI